MIPSDLRLDLARRKAETFTLLFQYPLLNIREQLLDSYEHNVLRLTGYQRKRRHYHFGIALIERDEHSLLSLHWRDPSYEPDPRLVEGVGDAIAIEVLEAFQKSQGPVECHVDAGFKFLSGAGWESWLPVPVSVSNDNLASQIVQIDHMGGSVQEDDSDASRFLFFVTAGPERGDIDVSIHYENEELYGLSRVPKILDQVYEYAMELMRPIKIEEIE